MVFRPFAHWLRSRRTATMLARAALRQRIVSTLADRPGPPAVALARARYGRHPDITIDPLETGFRASPRGFEVRAWVLVPHGEVPARLKASLVSTTEKLAPLSQTDHRIFFLNTAYGIAFADIAILLGLRRRDVRRAMVRAIASLDAKGGADAVGGKHDSATAPGGR